MSKLTALSAMVPPVSPSVQGAGPSGKSLMASAAAAMAAWEGKVMTVTGLIPADQMGITLPHEHVLIRVLGPKTDLQEEGLATEELALFGKSGGRTLVDLTSGGIGRNPLALKRISEKTGVQIVMGCGYYKDQWQNPAVRAMTEDDLFEEIVRDIVEGVDGVHAGVIGELGVDYPPKDAPLYPFEEKQLRAGARAQKATGAAINVHIECNSTPYEVNRIMNIIEQAGGDLSRVVASHRLPRLWEVHINVALAKRGCYVEFDTFGLEIWDSLRNQLNGKEDAPATIKALIAEGCLDNILISQDFDCQLCYVKNGGHGYAHILKNVVPQLKAAGITDEQIRTIMVENPKRLFSFKNYARQSAAAGEMNRFKGLDHLAIAVTNTEEALKIWRDQFGFPVLFSEKVAGGATLLTHLDLGNTHLQLVEPLTPEHPLRAWLATHGPGLHHVCLKVDDVGRALVEFPKAGLPVAPATHQGTQGKRALFVDKAATQNVQVEITGA